MAPVTRSKPNVVLRTEVAPGTPVVSKARVAPEAAGAPEKLKKLAGKNTRRLDSVKNTLLGSESPLPRANNSSNGAPVKNRRSESSDDDQQVKYFNSLTNTDTDYDVARPQESDSPVTEFHVTLPQTINPSERRVVVFSVLSNTRVIFTLGKPVTTPP